MLSNTSADSVLQYPKAFNPDLNCVTMVHPADASRGSCEDDVPRKECHYLGEVADQKRDAKNEFVGV